MKCQEQVIIFHIIIGINKSPALMKRQRVRNSSTTGDKQQHSSNHEIKYRPPLREYYPPSIQAPLTDGYKQRV